MSRCIESRVLKTVVCQPILLEIFPRLTSFPETYGNVPFQEILDHCIRLADSQPCKFPLSLLTIGLLAVDRPKEIQAKIGTILNILKIHFQQSQLK